MTRRLRSGESYWHAAAMQLAMTAVATGLVVLAWWIVWLLAASR